MKTSIQNPLKGLLEYGQSVWLDYIRRSLITSGDLKRLIQKDGLRGVTSNPAIFGKAIAGSMDYKDMLSAASSQKLDAKTLYEKIAVRDIQAAADSERAQQRRLPPDHVRGHHRPADAGAAIYLRHRQGCSGPRGLPSVGGEGPSSPPGRSRQRCRRRSG